MNPSSFTQCKFISNYNKLYFSGVCSEILLRKVGKTYTYLRKTVRTLYSFKKELVISLWLC